MVLTMVNENFRTPLIVATMLGDLPTMRVLWNHGAGRQHQASAARDGGGFTALMHALQLGHRESVAWLIAAPPAGAGASLAPSDVQTLTDRGVSVAGIPLTVVQIPNAYIGRGSATWTHPGSVNFTVAPYDSNTDPQYASFYGGPAR